MKLSHQFITGNTVQDKKPTGRGYKIDNHGDIVNPKGNQLTPEWDHLGYVSFLDNHRSDHRETKHFRPHRLVGELFLDKPEILKLSLDERPIDTGWRLVYKNGEHDQNSVLNLQWQNRETELDNEPKNSNSEVQ